MAHGQDTVTLRPELGSPGKLVLHGEVLEYNGRKVTIRLAGDIERSYPSRQVLWVETPHSAQWDLAENRFRAHDYANATEAFLQALEEESRPWVRRELMAQLVQCYKRQEKTEQAVETFLSLYRSDPDTPHLWTIPLQWRGVETPASLAARCREWLNEDQWPAAVLLGASHQLTGRDRSEAIEKLLDLAKQPDRRIAQLAEAQVWRTRLAAAGTEELGEWEDAIHEMPAALRGGPFYVLADAYALRGKPREAALSYLWLPLVHDDDPILAASACVKAAESLELAGQTAEAHTLYREALHRFSFTPAAVEARRQLRDLLEKQAGPSEG